MDELSERKNQAMHCSLRGDDQIWVKKKHLRSPELEDNSIKRSVAKIPSLNCSMCFCTPIKTAGQNAAFLGLPILCLSILYFIGLCYR